MGGLGGVKNGCKRGVASRIGANRVFCFREVCGVRGDTSSASQAQRKALEF